ncbi:acetyl-CoA hydrolase/transferase family protein [Patulibacter defluvii]|uniref:acetyl-CoA hydrolase/transferase family protein n=1 Tax=Patulibacter defluvii TaxID=3095358 RepID=UPI002A751316|nr:acetyl-CoA hydrolase/transferase C-terminal domain-containing protein [Patulibacter sp. DM4]
MSVREGRPEDVLDLVRPGDDLVVAMANGEPAAAIDALEREHRRLDGVRIHQMHAMRRRPHIDGACGEHLRHVSYFLTAATRPAAWAGHCDAVPVDFSQLPRLLRERTRCSLLLATVSPPDDDGWCTLGTNAEYVAALRRDAPLFLEVDERMPRVGGSHRVRLADVAGWYRSSRPLTPLDPAPAGDPRDAAIAAAVAERVPDGATIQIGVGRVPDAVCRALRGHRDLGLHSELLSDGAMDLIERGVLTGARKRLRPGQAVATFALGSERLHRWLDGHPGVALEPVDWVNDPRTVAREDHVVSINATTEVDLLGQCASETIGGRPWSGSGGQVDFALGALWARCGEAFVVLRSTTSDGRSRIRTCLAPGSAVTTSRNAVDHVVTEWGVAALRGRTIAERAVALIAVADPAHREQLEREARAVGLLHDRRSSRALGVPCGR